MRRTSAGRLAGLACVGVMGEGWVRRAVLRQGVQSWRERRQLGGFEMRMGGEMEMGRETYMLW